MRLSKLIIVSAIFSSSVFGQSEDTSKNSGMINVLEPTFKGTNESFDINDYIEENLIIPLNGPSWGVAGAVVTQFQVLPSGNLSEIQVIDGVSPDFDRSVISTLEATNGMWYPGTINDRPVPMEKEVIFVFRFEGTDIYQAAQMNKNKADDLMKDGKYNRAVKNYTKALAACPISDILAYRRGLAKYYSGDLEGALIDFERVADMDSHRADPMLAKLNEVVDFAKNELQLSSLTH